jgi:hypothetical protein
LHRLLFGGESSWEPAVRIKNILLTVMCVSH